MTHDLPVLDESSLQKDHSREPRLPDILYDAHLSAEDFAEPCEDALAIDEGAVLSFIATKEGLSISLPMRFAKQGFVAQPIAQKYDFFAKHDVTIKGKYAAKFLSDASPPKGVFSTVRVRSGKDYPLELLYENTNSKLRVVIAERTDED